MFASPAFAQSSGAVSDAAASGGTSGFLVSMFPFLLIFVIFYLLLIRPQQQRMRKHQNAIGAVKKNDVVITGGGLVGKVIKVDEMEVEVELAANVRVRALKSTLSEIRPFGTKPAND